MPANLTDIDIALALAAIREMQAAFKRLETTLETVREGAVQGQTAALPPCDVPVTEHRRQHRSGVPSVIDSNPTLQAFILGRIDRLTFKQIADDIAANFPPNLHIHQSTIHRWSRRRR